MKSLNRIALYVIAMCMLTGTAVSSRQTGTKRDIVDTAMSVHRFDTFLMLARDADLVFNLKDKRHITIFAPTDKAFEAMPKDVFEKIHGNRPRLREFVLHHIVRGSWTAEAAVRAGKIKALDGRSLSFKNVNGVGYVEDSVFSITNIRTSNGVLHGISDPIDWRK